jgi:ribosomal protein S27AE
MNDKEVTCPYCKEDFEVDTDDGRHYQDGGTEEEECPNCEKTVLITSSCSWYREAEMADCLNGAPHPWREWTTYWVGENGENKGKFYERRYCTRCSKEQWAWHKKRLDTRPSERFDKEPIGRYE